MIGYLTSQEALEEIRRCEHDIEQNKRTIRLLSGTEKITGMTWRGQSTLSRFINNDRHRIVQLTRFLMDPKDYGFIEVYNKSSRRIENKRVG